MERMYAMKEAFCERVTHSDVGEEEEEEEEEEEDDDVEDEDDDEV